MQVSSGKKFSLMARMKSFKFASRGIAIVLRSQHNLWIHLSALIIVIAAGFFFRITPAEWCIILLSSALVICMEIMNTALEFLVDFISPGYHEKAGEIKDLSAAAVLVSAIFALIIGVLIFGPYIMTLVAPSSALK